MITAHSGADGTKENSLEFVAYAMQTGADALEVDVRMGENGILILSHDKTDEDAVRLADVFRMMGKYPGMRINCDLKECGLEVAVRQLALISGLKTEQILYSGSVQSGLLSDRGAGIPDSGSLTADRKKVVPPVVHGGLCGSIFTVFCPAATGNG